MKYVTSRKPQSEAKLVVYKELDFYYLVPEKLHNTYMLDKEAKARIKINKFLEEAGWRFFKLGKSDY